MYQPRLHETIEIFNKLERKNNSAFKSKQNKVHVSTRKLNSLAFNTHTYVHTLAFITHILLLAFPQAYKIISSSSHTHHLFIRSILSQQKT